MSQLPDISSRCRPLSLSHRSGVVSPSVSSDSSSSGGKGLGITASRLGQHVLPGRKLNLNQPLHLRSSPSNSDASYAVAYADRQRSNTYSDANENNQTNQIALPYASNSKAFDKSLLKIEDNISTFMNYVQDQAKILNSFREEKEQIRKLHQQQTEKHMIERQEYESLHCELDEMQENLRKSAEHKIRLNTRILHLEKQLSFFSKKNEHLTKEVNVLKQQNTHQSQQLEKEKENVRNARTSETKTKEELVSISQSKEEVQEELQYLQQKLEEQTSQKEDIIADRDAYHANVMKLEKELEQIKHAMEQKLIHQNMEVQDLHCIIDQGKKEITTMQGTLASNRKEISQLQEREVNYNSSIEKVLNALEKHAFFLWGINGKINLLFSDSQCILKSLNETSTLPRICESFLGIKNMSISAQKVEETCNWTTCILLESGILDTKLVELLQNEIKLEKMNKNWIIKSQLFLNDIVGPLDEAYFNCSKSQDYTSSLGCDLQKILSLNSKDISLLQKQLQTVDEKRALCEKISNQQEEQISNLHEKLRKQKRMSCEWVQESKKNDVILRSSIKFLRDTLEQQRLLFHNLKNRAVESKTSLTMGIEFSLEALHTQNHEKRQLLAQLKEVRTGLKEAERELECVTQLAHTDHKEHATVVLNLNNRLSQVTSERDKYKALISSSVERPTVMQETNQQNREVVTREVTNRTIDHNQTERVKGSDMNRQEFEGGLTVSDENCRSQMQNRLTSNRLEQGIPKLGSKKQKRNTTAQRANQDRYEKNIAITTAHVHSNKKHAKLNVRSSKLEQAQNSGRISKATPRRSPSKRRYADRNTKLINEPPKSTPPPKSAFQSKQAVRSEDDEDWVVQDVTLE